MDEWNQPSREPSRDLAPPNTPVDPPDAGIPPPPEGPRLPSSRAALLTWLAILVGFGGGGMLFGQQELALLAAFAGVFVAAHVADEDPQWRELYFVLGWVPPAIGIALSVGVGWMLWKSELSGPLRAVLVLVSACGAGLVMAMVPSPVAHFFSRVMLRAERPRHVLHLTARCVMLTFAFAIPGWFAAQDVLEEMLRDPAGLLDKAGLGGGLIGYVLLAFAGVGWLVRLDLRGAAARLGLRVPGVRDLVAAGLAIAGLWLLNHGAEWIQARWLPDSYAADQRISTAMASGLGPGRIVLLGLSAGIGEEITLRGGLQPRLGVGLTALLFAALHVQYSWFGMLVIFALGALLGEVRRRTSTTAAILAHVAYDVIAISLQ